MAVFVKVMSLTAIIFSLYILYLFLRQQRTPTSQNVPPYHLGCYSDNHTVNHYTQIKLSIDSLFEREEHAFQKTNMHHSIALLDHSFEERSIDVARKFDIYIHKLIENGANTRSNIQIFTNIMQTERNYKECQLEIQSNFNSSQCQSQWSKYQQCFTQLKSIEVKITDLTLQRDLTLAKIESFLQPGNSSNSFHEIIKKAEKQYNREMKVNNEVKEDLLKRLEIAISKNETSFESRKELVEKESVIAQSHYECTSRIIEFENCEKITKQIDTLGYGGISALEDRNKNKQKMLSKLLTILSQSQHKQSVQSIRALYNQGKEDLKIILKILIEAQQEIKKHCGCTETYQFTLKTQLKRLSTQIEAMNKTVVEIETLIKDINMKLGQNEEDRERIIKRFNDIFINATSFQFNFTEAQLKELKNNLTQFNQNISNHNQSYTNLEKQCALKKLEISSQLKDIDTIHQCLSKKQYFLKLKNSLKIYIHDDDSKNLIVNPKAALKAALEQFQDSDL